MEAPRHIGKNILSLRLLRGIKQEALADLMGISQQAISKIEQVSNLEDNTLARVAKALGVSPDVIRNYDGDKMIMTLNNAEPFKAPPAKAEPPVPTPNYSFNPMDKLMEVIDKLHAAMEENKKLYEALLNEKEEKIKMMEKYHDSKQHLFVPVDSPPRDQA